LFSFHEFFYESGRLNCFLQFLYRIYQKRIANFIKNKFLILLHLPLSITAFETNLIGQARFDYMPSMLLVSKNKTGSGDS